MHTAGWPSLCLTWIFGAFTGTLTTNWYRAPWGSLMVRDVNQPMPLAPSVASPLMPVGHPHLRVVGFVVPYVLHQLGKILQMLKRRNAARRAREEAARRARVLRLKASKQPGSLPQEGSVTDSESESEDSPLRREGSRSDIPVRGEKETSPTAEAQVDASVKPKAVARARAVDVPALVISVAHELSYVFLSNALYFSSCYYWTGTQSS